MIANRTLLDALDTLSVPEPRPRFKPLYIAAFPPTLWSLMSFTLASSAGIDGLPMVLLWLSGVLGFFDACARYREYVNLVLLLETNAVPSKRTIKYFRGSYCRRWAAVQAGVPVETFTKLGHKWWHLLPVGAPMCLVKPTFWRGFFGCGKQS